ncbi:MAG: hypothetical protein HY272_03130 [Gammaproteobacteria bacterium]|nr:hypothetical protein [Gammaproteobacteria bacterium]
MFARKSLLFIGLSILASLAQAAMDGATPASFAVNANGSATYTIPIQVPPGFNGIEPKLAIIYNSQQGNGLLGVGWSLSGLSAISRCPGTIAVDGARSGIDLTAERFCLDGQRLIKSATGTGYNEYRTEIDSFSRIRAYFTGSGTSTAINPDYFKVWTKSAQILEYGNTSGNTSNSKILMGTSALTWGLNRQQDIRKDAGGNDVAGNFLNVTYATTSAYIPNSTQAFGAGVLYPTKIEYSAAPYSGFTPVLRSVEFVYQTRTDNKNTKYVAGYSVLTNALLDKVVTKYSGTTVRSYDLDYENETTGAARSRLTNVYEGGTDSVNLTKPISIVWRASSNAAPAMASAGTQAVATASGKTYADLNKHIDVNGDGWVDLITADPSAGSATVYLAKSTLGGAGKRRRV